MWLSCLRQFGLIASARARDSPESRLASPVQPTRRRCQASNDEAVTAIVDTPAVTSDMSTAAEPWMYDPAVMQARQESWFAHLSWEKVAPPDGELPADATPLQRLLHARMVTSDFAYDVVKQVVKRRS